MSLFVVEPAANLAERSAVVGCSAAAMEAAAAQLIAALAVAFPTGGVAGIELAAGAAGGVCCLTVLGTRGPSDAIAYASAVVRCAAAADPATFDAQLERIRAAQAASGASSLYGAHSAIGGAGAVFCAAQVWGPPAAPPPVTSPDGIDTLLRGEGVNVGGGSRQAQATFEGSTYYTFRDLLFNRVVARVNTVVTPGGRLEGAFYQAPDGLSGSPMDLAGRFTIDPVDAPGNVTVATAAPVTLVAGIFAVVWGFSAAQGGNFSMSVRTNAAISLLTTNVVAGTHPITFTTAFTIDGGAPATLDVAAQTAATVDIVPSIRVRRL